MKTQTSLRVLGIILVAVAVSLVIPALLYNLQKYAMQDPALLASVGWNF